MGQPGVAVAPWPCRATQSPAAENDKDVPPSAIRWRVQQRNLPFPPVPPQLRIVTELLEVVRRRRSQQRSPPSFIARAKRRHARLHLQRSGTEGRMGLRPIVNVRNSIGDERCIMYTIGVRTLSAQGTKKTYHNNGGNGIGSSTGCYEDGAVAVVGWQWWWMRMTWWWQL